VPVTATVAVPPGIFCALYRQALLRLYRFFHGDERRFSPAAGDETTEPELFDEWAVNKSCRTPTRLSDCS